MGFYSTPLKDVDLDKPIVPEWCKDEVSDEQCAAFSLCLSEIINVSPNNLLMITQRFIKRFSKEAISSEEGVVRTEDFIHILEYAQKTYRGQRWAMRNTSRGEAKYIEIVMKNGYALPVDLYIGAIFSIAFKVCRDVEIWWKDIVKVMGLEMFNSWFPGAEIKVFCDELGANAGISESRYRYWENKLRKLKI